MRSLLIFAAWLVSTSACAATLHIHFTGVKTMHGHLLVAVYGNAKAFQAHKALASKQVALKGKKSPVTLSIDLPPGRYAVQAMQDINDNHRMDLNRMGIPTEPVGTSNNPHAPHAPTFKESAFKLPASGQNIDMAMYVIHI